jgi:hypothetical protein
MLDMLFETLCKQGKIQVDNTMIRCIAPFYHLVWEAPKNTVTKIVIQKGRIAADLVFCTTQSPFTVEMVPDAEKLLALFPNVKIVRVHKGLLTPWYQHIALHTHIATYTNEWIMQHEAEAAAQYGWTPQDTTGIRTHGKEKIMITYVRTPDWLTRYEE